MKSLGQSRSHLLSKPQMKMLAKAKPNEHPRHFKVRMCKHLGISALAGKRVKGDDDSGIKEHLSFCNHEPDFEDFSILATNSNKFKVTLMKSLLINKDHPENKQSLPLKLFDS